MKIEVNIDKRYFLILVSLVSIIGIVLITNAYNPSGTGGNPESMGHSADELDVEFGDSVQKLQQVFNNLDSNNDGIIDETEFANNAEYSENTGNIEWNNVNNKPGVIENSDEIATKDYVDENGGGTLSINNCKWSGIRHYSVSYKTCRSYFGSDYVQVGVRFYKDNGYTRYSRLYCCRLSLN